VPEVLRVTCVERTSQQGRRDVIRLVGGFTVDGVQLRLTAAEAIRGIEENRWELVVHDRNGKRIRVVVGHHLATKYLTTEADPYEPYHLIELPHCE
jgi:hypothetical protein